MPPLFRSSVAGIDHLVKHAPHSDPDVLVRCVPRRNLGAGKKLICRRVRIPYAPLLGSSSHSPSATHRHRERQRPRDGARAASVSAATPDREADRDYCNAERRPERRVPLPHPVLGQTPRPAVTCPPGRSAPSARQHRERRGGDHCTQKDENQDKRTVVGQPGVVIDQLADAVGARSDDRHAEKEEHQPMADLTQASGWPG